MQLSDPGMIHHRATAGGIRTKSDNYSFRATGIAEYLRNGGKLKSAHTTGLYDRRTDQVLLDEVERIVI